MPDTPDILARVDDEEQHGIPGELAHLAVPLGELTPYPGNAKLHDVPALRASLRQHGQYRPVVVQRSTGQVLAGNGTMTAARAEGWTHLAAVRIDCDDDRARRINLVDNRSSELGGGYDPDALLHLLTSLADTPDALAGTGYDLDALDALLAGPGDTDPAYVVPAGSDAAYAETDEETAARADRLTHGAQHLAAAALTEVILVLPEADAAVFRALASQVRTGLGGADLTTGQAALGGLRCAVALIEAGKTRVDGDTVLTGAYQPVPA